MLLGIDATSAIFVEAFEVTDAGDLRGDYQGDVGKDAFAVCEGPV